jgi:hypothetical protein
VLRGKRLAALGLGLVLFGCGTDAGSTAGPVNTAYGAVATTQPRWTPAQQEVVDAYLAAVDVIHDAQRTGEDPGEKLNRVLAEPLLTDISSELSSERISGKRIRPSAVNQAKVTVEQVLVDASDEAQLIDCDIDDFVSYDATSGSVIDDSTNTGHRTETLKRDGGSWKWATRVVNEKAEGVSGCALVG